MGVHASATAPASFLQPQEYVKLVLTHLLALRSFASSDIQYQLLTMNYTTAPQDVWNGIPAYSHPPLPPYFADIGPPLFEDHSFALEDLPASSVETSTFQAVGMHRYTSTAPVGGRALDNGLTAQRILNSPSLTSCWFVGNAHCDLGGVDTPDSRFGLAPAPRKERPWNAAAAQLVPAGYFNNAQHALNDYETPINHFEYGLNDSAQNSWHISAQQAFSSTSSDTGDDFSGKYLLGDQFDLHGSDSNCSPTTLDDPQLADVGSPLQNSTPKLLPIVSGLRKDENHNEEKDLRLKLVEKDLIIAEKDLVIAELSSKLRQNQVCTVAMTCQ